MSRLKILLWILLCIPSLASARLNWVTGYYCTWWGTSYKKTVDFSCMTHVILFGTNPYTAYSSTSYLDTSDVWLNGSLPDFVSASHSAGCKVLMAICAGYNVSSVPVIMDDTAKANVYIAAACAFARRHQLDGIDLDWEFPYTADSLGWYHLIHTLRQEMDKNNWGASDSAKGVLTMASHVWSGVMTSKNYGYSVGRNTVADFVSVFDQINLMSYNMFESGQTGYNSPVYAPASYSNYGGSNISTSVPPWTSKIGIAKSKLGIGCTFEGYIFVNTSGIAKSYSSGSFITTDAVPAWAAKHWDDTAKANIAFSHDTAWAYEDTNSIKAIVSWAKTNNYGGLMIYNLSAGYTTSNALLSVAGREALTSSETTAINQASVNNDGYSLYLHQNYPNPFNPSTTIQISLPALCSVTLRIYNILGQEVALLMNGTEEAGYHTVTWNARAASGIYFCRLEAVSVANPNKRFSETRKMLLVR